jgi:uncharacterized protein with GYD domain
MPTIAHEQRRRAETCRLQAEKAPTKDHRAYWCKMADDWVALAEARDDAERRILEERSGTLRASLP